MAEKLTYDAVKEFIEEEGYTLLSEEYVNSKTKLKVRCPEGHEYEVPFSSFKYSGHRCPKCSLRSRSEKRKHSYSYVKDFIEREGFELLSEEYAGSRSKLLVRCPKGHEIETSFFNFQQGNRCKICSRKKKYTFSEVKEIVESEGYTLLSSESEYKNSHSKIKLRCPNGHEYEVVFYSFTQGKRCAKCKGNMRFSVDDVRKYFQEHGYEWMSGEYKNNHSKLVLKCSEGHIFTTTLKNFKRRPACKICKRNDSTNNPNWKGGVWKKNLPLYDTYAHQLDWCEEVRRDPDNEDLLQVRCYESSCRKWFTPKLKDVTRRIQALKDNLTGEQHFYCSDGCKQRCSIFRKIKYPKGYKQQDLTRELQPELREIVFERDNWTCQKCGSTKDLQCHHILPVKLEPIESADVDNCITFCKKCHKEVHTKLGCTYDELRKLCNS